MFYKFIIIGVFILVTILSAISTLYDDAVINGNKVNSFSMLTINSEHHPFMNQLRAPKDEKRSIIVIPDQYRKD